MTLNSNHWTMLLYRQRMTIKEWRNVLLAEEDIIVFNGTPCKLKAKNIGAGIVEVYKVFEKENIDAAMKEQAKKEQEE